MFFDELLKMDSLPYNFNNTFLKADSSYRIKSGWTNFYFNSIDTLNTKIIAAINDKKANYIKINYGLGDFFIHNQPFAFTNYNLLFKNNAEYAFKALSYLRNDIIYWDENYKLVLGNEFKDERPWNGTIYSFEIR